jgi:hypothetical protein
MNVFNKIKTGKLISGLVPNENEGREKSGNILKQDIALRRVPCRKLCWEEAISLK